MMLRLALNTSYPIAISLKYYVEQFSIIDQVRYSHTLFAKFMFVLLFFKTMKFHCVLDRSNLTENSEQNAFALEPQTSQKLENHQMISRYNLEFVL